MLDECTFVVASILLHRKQQRGGVVFLSDDSSYVGDSRHCAKKLCCFQVDSVYSNRDCQYRYVGR